MKNSHIEWTDHTFNPWIGCTKVSPGCTHCYAEALNKRWRKGENWGPGAPRKRTSVPNWKEPLKWNQDAAYDEINHADEMNLGKDLGPYVRPRVFCASLADWLDDEVPIEWLADLLKLIHDTPNLDWLLLTKRPENWRLRLEKALLELQDDSGDDQQEHGWVDNWLCYDTVPSNVWIGATVEDQSRADERLPLLFSIPAKVRFLSCEPLLGLINLSRAFEVWEYCGNCGHSFDYLAGRADVCPDCKIPNCMSAGFGSYQRDEYDNNDGRMPVKDGNMIDWVICGGESGPGARPMDPNWARGLRNQCQSSRVPFFFKQWGEWVTEMPAMFKAGKKQAGRLLDSLEWNEFPA